MNLNSKFSVKNSFNLQRILTFKTTIYVLYRDDVVQKWEKCNVKEMKMRRFLQQQFPPLYNLRIVHCHITNILWTEQCVRLWYSKSILLIFFYLFVIIIYVSLFWNNCHKINVCIQNFVMTRVKQPIHYAEHH